MIPLVDVMTNGMYSKSFKVTTGVLQGDTLAPFLFVIVLDYVMNQIPRDHGLVTQVDARLVVEDLDFADDLALPGETIKATRDHITPLQRSAKEVGLKINMKKTKIMASWHILPCLGISRWLMVRGWRR